MLLPCALLEHGEEGMLCQTGKTIGGVILWCGGEIGFLVHPKILQQAEQHNLLFCASTLTRKLLSDTSPVFQSLRGKVKLNVTA